LNHFQKNLRKVSELFEDFPVPGTYLSTRWQAIHPVSQEARSPLWAPHAAIFTYRRGGNAVQPQTTPHSPFPIKQAFVVQFATETTLDVQGLTGRVEHIVSGHATRFASAEALFALMVERLQDVQQTSRVERDTKDV
jgi:hypothetical protein